MNRNDWLDEILYRSWQQRPSDNMTFGEYKKSMNTNLAETKQKILDYISKNYVTKQECEKHMLEASYINLQVSEDLATAVLDSTPEELVKNYDKLEALASHLIKELSKR